MSFFKAYKIKAVLSVHAHLSFERKNLAASIGTEV
jgi:hypothetical protein